MRRALRRTALVVAAIALMFTVAPTPSAQAHAFLLTSNPADGAVLADAPGQLRLRFSESIVVEVTRIELVWSDGTVTMPSHLRQEGSADDPEQPMELVADLPPLGHGAYRVSWQTLSKDDLHRTAGVFVFGVGQQVAAAGGAEPLPRPEEALLRWAFFVGIAAALGGRLAARLYRRGPQLPQLANRCERLAMFGAVGALGCSIALLVDQSRSSGATVGRLLESSYGTHWAVRECGLLLLIAAGALARRSSSDFGRLGRLVLIGAGAVLAAVGTAQLGHASSGVTALLADAAHLIAAAFWSGALAVTILVGMLATRTGAAPAGAMRSALRGFAGPAAGCIATIAVTGLYLTSTVVGSVDAALMTFYGRTLLLKTALFAVIAVLGLINHRRVRAVASSVRRVLIADCLVALMILGLAAVLTSSQPAREPEFIRPPSPRTVPVLDAAVADLQQTLAVRPNRPGRNVVLVEVFDTRRPAPAPISGVSVQVTAADGRNTGSIAAQRLTDGRWSAPVELVTSGRVAVQVTVQRPGIGDATGRFSWTVAATPVATRPVTVSNSPLSTLLSRAAAGLAALLLVSALGMAIRNRRLRSRPAHRAAGDGVPAAPNGQAPMMKSGVG